MADNRKYYYLKLKENFFDSDSIVLLEDMKDGILYSNILLKLYLKSLKNGGKLQLDEHIPYTAQMIATLTRHQIGTVERDLEIFRQLGLVEQLDSGAFYMTDIELMIGQSSTDAERQRAARLENKALLPPRTKGGHLSDIRPPEIELELEKEIKIEKEREGETGHPAPAAYGRYNNVILLSLIHIFFNLLCDKADDQYGGKLPVHVRCLIDECANIGQIPQLEKLVATIRSREISACLVLQTRSQLKAIYKDNADTIVGNMDSQIFLGGSEPTTLKDLAEALGKETIDSCNNSDTRGNSPSYGTNYQKLGHELMSRDELAVLDGGKCILQLRGVRPFLSDKYDLTPHPNYKMCIRDRCKAWNSTACFLR